MVSLRPALRSNGHATGLHLSRYPFPMALIFGLRGINRRPKAFGQVIDIARRVIGHDLKPETSIALRYGWVLYKIGDDSKLR